MSETHFQTGTQWLLDLRGPGWLCLPAGAVAGGASAGAMIGGAALVFGVVAAPSFLLAVAGFFAFALIGGVSLPAAPERNIASLVSSVMAVGHMLILLAFLLLLASPALTEMVQNVVSLPEALDVAAAGASAPDEAFSLFGTGVGPRLVYLALLYASLFGLFTVVVPFSLIVFRYVALRKFSHA